MATFDRYVKALKSVNDFIITARATGVTFPIPGVLRSIALQNDVDVNTLAEVYSGALALDDLEEMLTV